LQDAIANPEPWCCFVSLSEPNEPPVCGRGAYDEYPLDAIKLPATQHDNLAGRPGLYAKSAGLWNHLSDREKRELLASQYGSITEIDALFGRLLERLQNSGALENTIVVFTSDHGNLLGAHGLLAHNVSAFEELYHIPMILRGPGLAQDQVREGIVSLADVGPTLLDLCGLEGLRTPDAKSFAALLGPNGAKASTSFNATYAEYFGARYRLTQRVLWENGWKFVFNGFDHDEMYDLKNDPQELRNLADDPAHRERADAMMAAVWRRIRDTGDKTLWESHWPGVRWARVGPLKA
jgi:arylsulfatase A-like enzyme